MLTRRFNRWQAAQEAAETPGKKPDPAFALLPDLLIVDGGKGQLGRAVKVLEHFGSAGQGPGRRAGQAEGRAVPPRPAASILLPRHSQGLYLVQRIRDEAHRFAITAHRKRRTKEGLASRLDAIPGIGPARRKQLLNRFGSIEDIQDASLEELMAVPGVTEKIAQSIRAFLE